jgi:hypothetical protein
LFRPRRRVLPHDQRVVAGDDVMRARRMGAQCIAGLEHVADSNAAVKGRPVSMFS